MTRIDFRTNIADKLSYACRLARKVVGGGHTLVLLTEDAAQAASLDAALWNLSETDFLPHVMAGDALAAHTPIVIACMGSDDDGEGDSESGGTELPQGHMLINLTRHTPANVERFQRVFELISTDPDDVAAGRKRYLDYKQKSYLVDHIVAAAS